MSAVAVPAALGTELVARLAADIADCAGWLSELDGAIGDGDHGINMRKGMELAATRVGPDVSVGDALRLVATTLLDDVGGAMGPLYGVFFLALSDAADGQERIDAETFGRMLAAGSAAVVDIGGAQLGDKTLVDVLLPATEAFAAAVAAGRGFAEALLIMARTAESARDATKELVARLGRASRVAERSRGHIDAGAASCSVLLRSIAITFHGALLDEPRP